MNVRNQLLAAMTAATATFSALANPISQADAERAVASFLTNDAIGSAILGDRTVDGVKGRDGLWIVSLAPSGHVILSASDRAKPIVGFSANDFAEPAPGSPAYAMLQAAGEGAVALEADAAAQRNTEWDALLARRTPQKPLLGNAAVSDLAQNAIIVEPFLKTHFNQCQPYNDFAPIYDAPAIDTEDHRGRCPAGCVATAAATVLNYFKWPARIDGSLQYDATTRGGANFYDASNVAQTFPIRFDGHNPIDWDAIQEEYISSYRKTNWVSETHWRAWTEYDLRGKVAESTRFPIARLLLWADVIGKMQFGALSSSTSYDPIAENLSEWYTTGEWITNSFERVVPYLQAKIPCQVSFNGHQVVVHGWADDGNNKYAYFDFGWGGSNDGYYDIDERIDGNYKNQFKLEQIYIGHYPRAKPQIEPIPSISQNKIFIRWSFPDIYTNNLTGFNVYRYRTSNTPTNIIDDFSAPIGISTDASSIYVGTDTPPLDERRKPYYTQPDNGNLLYAKSTAIGYWNITNTYSLTSASVLTFNFLSFSALGSSCEIQAKPANGEWQTLYTPPLKTDWGCSGWSTERKYLGELGGETVRLRIAYKYDKQHYYDDGRILIDDFKVTNVLAPEVIVTNENSSATARSRYYTPTSGYTYTFAVTPLFSDPFAGAFPKAETSDPISITFEGTRKTPTTGQETFNTRNLSFSTTDTSGIWSYSGIPSGSTAIKATIENRFQSSISAKTEKFPGTLSSDSLLKFTIQTANNLYGVHDYEGTSYDCFDFFDVLFVSTTMQTNQVWTTNYTAQISTPRTISVPISDYAGKLGTFVIRYFHYGVYNRDGSCTISSPQITNVRVPTVPGILWKNGTPPALGTPSITSVTPVDDGFYSDCTTNTTTFSVQCSEHVTGLAALPSHLSLVDDSDINITTNENNNFTVAITPHGINENNYRSRMILTLVATDKNGTKAYKDLSLRFDKVEEPTVTIEIPDPSDLSGATKLSVAVSCDWMDAYGLVAEGGTYESAVYDDSDDDGIPNWQEYLCSTNPTNAEDKIECNIGFDENGSVTVTSSLDGRTLPSGYQAVIKGRSNLGSGDWEAHDTSRHYFFKVVIEKTE